MPDYIVDIEFGFETKVIIAKNQTEAIDKADIPIGAVFTIRKKKRSQKNV